MITAIQARLISDSPDDDYKTRYLLEIIYKDIEHSANLWLSDIIWDIDPQDYRLIMTTLEELWYTTSISYNWHLHQYRIRR